MTTTEPTRSTDALLVAQLLAAEKGGGQADGTLIAGLVDCLMETDPPLWNEPHLRGLWQRHPASDGLRLLYAEWLERVPDVKCPKCKGKGFYSYNGAEFGYTVDDCEDCEKKGTAPDTSARDRAALIRVQCKLERMPAYRNLKLDIDWDDPGYSAECRRAVALRIRERDLIAAHPEWLVMFCPACRGQSDAYECAACDDTGDLMLLHGDRGRRPHTWDRGWLVVECDSGDVWREVANHDWDAPPRKLVPTPWAAAVCHHVAGLALTDATHLVLPPEIAVRMATPGKYGPAYDLAKWCRESSE